MRLPTGARIALSFAEVKALASGDPLILEEAQGRAEVTRLTRLERAFTRTQRTLRATIDDAASAPTRFRTARQVVREPLRAARTRGATRSL